VTLPKDKPQDCDGGSYGYPPDKQEKATQTVLEQAEVLCKDWTGMAA
jgi:hypothetical protein